MSRMFEDIQIYDQLELSVSRGAIIYTDDKSFNPDAIYRVAIVTHIWHDPVEAKDYLALAYIRNNGTYGKPHEKRTITGLARTGWRKAGRDWIEFLKAKDAADSEKVVSLLGRRKK